MEDGLDAECYCARFRLGGRNDVWFDLLRYDADKAAAIRGKHPPFVCYGPYRCAPG